MAINGAWNKTTAHVSEQDEHIRPSLVQQDAVLLVYRELCTTKAPKNHCLTAQEGLEPCAPDIAGGCCCCLPAVPEAAGPIKSVDIADNFLTSVLSVLDRKFNSDDR